MIEKDKVLELHEKTLKIAKRANRIAAIALAISIIAIIVLLFMQCIYILNNSKLKFLSTKLTERKRVLPGVLASTYHPQILAP